MRLLQDELRISLSDCFPVTLYDSFESFRIQCEVCAFEGSTHQEEVYTSCLQFVRVIAQAKVDEEQLASISEDHV